MNRLVFLALTALFGMAGLHAPTARAQGIASAGQPSSNVRSYGAVGDGKTDDTAALERAIRAAGRSVFRDNESRPATVFLPAGVYRLTRTIVLDSSVRLSRIRGEGHIAPDGSAKAPTVILWEGPKEQTMFDIRGLDGVRIDDIRFDGGGTAGIILRINSVVGTGTGNLHFGRIVLTRADIGIELGADLNVSSSDMSFFEVVFSNMRKCAFRAVHDQQVNYVFERCIVSHAPLGFVFAEGGSAHFMLPSFAAVDTCFDLNGGPNNGSYSITGLFMEGGSYSDPDKRMVILKARGETNIAITAIQTGTQKVWGAKADLTTPNFELDAAAQVSVRDSIISGRTAQLHGKPGQLTWIQFDNCRFTRASDPRRDISPDAWSGYELRNCTITTDDTRGEVYKVLGHEHIAELRVAPKNQEH